MVTFRLIRVALKPCDGGKSMASPSKLTTSLFEPHPKCGLVLKSQLCTASTCSTLIWIFAIAATAVLFVVVIYETDNVSARIEEAGLLLVAGGAVVGAGLAAGPQAAANTLTAKVSGNTKDRWR